MSHTLPPPLYQYMANHSIRQLEPAWLQLEKHGHRIISIGGAWQHYGTPAPQVGEKADERFDILMGMLPLESGFELPQVQLQDEQYTDIVAIQDTACDWLLFCDVTQSTLQLQQYQQVSNDLILLKAKMRQTLHRYVGHEVVQRIEQGDMQLDAAGERKHITTLFVDIRGFTPFNERHDAQEVMKTLNDYMDCMLPAIMRHHGMVDKIMGDGIMAIFGILPHNNPANVHALQAATDMIHRVHQENQKRKGLRQEQLGIGVGIASGEAVLGILGSHHRRTFSAIGRHVNLAARLESNARVGEILIDEATYQGLRQPDDFQPATLDLKGIGQTNVYARTLPCMDTNDTGDSPHTTG